GAARRADRDRVLGSHDRPVRVAGGLGREAQGALVVLPGQPGADGLPALLLQAATARAERERDAAGLPLLVGRLADVAQRAEVDQVPALAAGLLQGGHLGERGEREQDLLVAAGLRGLGRAEALLGGLAADAQHAADRLPAVAGAAGAGHGL